MVSQTINAIAAAAYGTWRHDDASMEEMRDGFDRMCPAPPPDVLVFNAEIGGVHGKWVNPPNAGSTVILHIHAGAFAVGSSQSHRDLAARIGRAAQARVFMPDYRGNPYPAAIDDVRAVYRGLVHDHGIDPARLVISGDSCGGGLVLVLLTALRDSGVALPMCGVLISAFADLTLSGATMTANEPIDPINTRAALHQWAANYLADHPADDPAVSPVFADLLGLPPLLIQVGTSEVLYSDSERIANRVLNGGGRAQLSVWKDMFSSHQMFADQIFEAQEAIDEIGQFIRLSADG